MTDLLERPWVARFWSHVDKDAPNGCWEWTAWRARLGYGQFRTRDPEVTTRFTHRIAFLLVRGWLPEFDGRSAELDHLCRNTACCNPDHLEPVTHFENLRRGNHFVRRQTAQTHCIHGHEFTPENTIWAMHRHGRPYRKCKTCRKRIAANRWRARADELNARRRELYARKKASA